MFQIKTLKVVAVFLAVFSVTGTGIQSASASPYNYPYSVTYASGGGTGSMDAQIGSVGCDGEDIACEITLAPLNFVNEGKVFNGWLDEANNYYLPGQTLTLDANLNLVLTAQWAGTCHLNDASCEIGDVGPGGGRIFLTPSSSGNTTGQYFEAVSDIAGRYYWCTGGMDVIASAMGTAIGTGRGNTAAISDHGCPAGNGTDVVSSFSSNGYQDWFIPSRDEVRAMSDSQTLIGMYQYDYILSSSYFPDNNFASWHFSGNYEVDLGTDYGFMLVPVRSFSLEPHLQPIPDPIQIDTATSLSIEAGTVGSMETITGNFSRDVQAIYVGGVKLKSGDWVQSPTSISFKLPEHADGLVKIQIFNGAAPLLPQFNFSYTGGKGQQIATGRPVKCVRATRSYIPKSNGCMTGYTPIYGNN